MKEHTAVYQLEVKRWLVAYRFPPSRGWQIRVDIDAMERTKGGQHRPDKAKRARAAAEPLRLTLNGLQCG